MSFIIISTVLGVFGGGRASGQCQYEVTVIQGPDCGIFGPGVTIGTAINNSGAVVGTHTCVLTDRAFLWTPENGFEFLPVPSGVTGMRAQDINDSGTIVGIMNFSGVGHRGFVYENGEYTILPPVFDEFGPISGAGSINNAGLVAGQRSFTREYQPRNAFVWSKDTGFIDLGLMGYETNSIPSNIHSDGTVTGTAGSVSNGEGFRWKDGILTLLGRPRGAMLSQAAGVGPLFIAGSYIESLAVPAIWTEQHGWTSIGLLPECVAGYSNDVSETTGVIVGPCSNDSSDRFPFVWYGTQLYNLNDLANSGDSIERPFAINEVGQIIADGHAGGTVTFLLTPIAPSPADTNGDCDTDFDDFTFLLSSWGLDEPRADFDEDGIVDFDDFVLLLANWTFVP